MSDTKNFEKHLREYKTQSPPKVLPIKPKVYNNVDHAIVNKLTSELADALIEKRKCEMENDVLKMENKNYHTRVKLLVTEIASLKIMQGNNIIAIEQQVSNIQSQIQPKANKICSETCIKSIQAKYAENLSEMEKKLHNEISALNDTLDSLKQNESNLKRENLRFKEKYHTYKKKLKFSVNIITNLNKHLRYKVDNRKEIGCQTQKEINKLPVDEDHLISELFFKDRPFHDDENLIFLSDGDKKAFY